MDVDGKDRKIRTFYNRGYRRTFFGMDAFQHWILFPGSFLFLFFIMDRYGSVLSGTFDDMVPFLPVYGMMKWTIFGLIFIGPISALVLSLIGDPYEVVCGKDRIVERYRFHERKMDMGQVDAYMLGTMSQTRDYIYLISGESFIDQIAIKDKTIREYIMERYLKDKERIDRKRFFEIRKRTMRE